MNTYIQQQVSKATLANGAQIVLGHLRTLKAFFSLSIDGKET